VLVHGYRAWGDDLPERLEGMYAFAIWDRDAGSLLLARDRFGEKPLHYRVKRNAAGDIVECVFATSRGVLAGPADDAASGELAACTTRYLQLGYGWGRDDPPGGSGTRRLPAGGRLRVDSGLRAGRLERLATSEGETNIEDALDAAVASRLEADVPLGCFLSGGVDSSLVAHFARLHRPDLRTFSVRMPDPRFDESEHAERVARHLGTDHTTLDVAATPAADLPKLIEQLGQPFADSSILPTHWVSRAARDHVAVALSGDGGDELFLGYERYLATPHLARHWRLLRWLPAGLRRGAHPRSRRDKLGRLGGMARAFPMLDVLATESLFAPGLIAALMGDAFDPSDLVRPHPSEASPITRLQREDLRRYLPEDLLVKVDTAAMSVALEVRCPFLDRALAGAALSLSPATLLAGGRKGLLRRIARAHLPAAIVDRPKMGFAIPIGEWFRRNGGSMHTQLNDHLRSTEPFGPLPVAAAPVERLIDEHESGRRDHGQRLFALLTLSMWARSAPRPGGDAAGL
ncbi:MAG: hypothetical protein HKO59_11340, partial [Phycisphaerales bacterium]|nr:hypothetical protein [Phycisphaerales bacterium]